MTDPTTTQTITGLGFACGKNCPTCNQPVSKDAQGRYLCFECGHLVEIDEGKV